MNTPIRHIILLFLITVSIPAFAQRYLSTERTVVIPKVLDLGVVAGSTAFNFTTTANYDAGIEKTALFTLTVKANVTWKISLSGSAALFSPTSTVTPMPLGVLSLRSPAIDANYYTIPYPTPLSSTGVKGEYVFTLDIKADPDYLYEQNTYLTNLYFVISEP
jgi:hypothetical protein